MQGGVQGCWIGGLTMGFAAYIGLGSSVVCVGERLSPSDGFVASGNIQLQRIDHLRIYVLFPLYILSLLL